MGHKEATGGAPGILDSGDESEIGRVVREFWEDPCNQDRLTSPETMRRVDQQLMVEGNVFVVLSQDKNDRKAMPKAAVLPTFAIQGILLDNLEDGNGMPLGYYVYPRSRDRFMDTGQRSKLLYPSMIADDPERCRKVLRPTASRKSRWTSPSAAIT